MIRVIDLKESGLTREEVIDSVQNAGGAILRQDGKVMVWGSDTLSGQQVQIAADLVVLAPAMLARPATPPLARMLGLPVDEYGWLVPLDANTHPVETVRPGVCLAGTGAGPMDIPETVAHASGAAAQVLKRFAQWQRRPGRFPKPARSIEGRE